MSGNPGQSTFPPPGILCKNLSGQIVPPRACVQLVPIDYAAPEFVGQTAANVTYFGIKQPSDENESDVYGFNGPAPIPVASGSVGYGLIDLAMARPALALIDSAIALPTLWTGGLAPVSGSWALGEGSRFTFGGVFQSFPDYGAFAFVLQGIGSGGVIPAIITEDEGSAQPVSVYRTSHEDYGFYVRRLDCAREPTGDEFVARADMLTNVHWTDKKIWLTKHCTDWQVLNSGASRWEEAFALENISETGGLVELWSGGPQEIATPKCGSTVVSGTSITVEFDDQAQLFWITDGCCQETVYP